MDNNLEVDAIDETNVVSKKLNNGDGGNGGRTSHGFTKFFRAIGDRMMNKSATISITPAFEPYNPKDNTKTIHSKPE